MASKASAAALNPPSSRGLHLDIRAVSHAFDLDGQALAVLDEVSFELKPGESLALLGPSGCGKSTLLRLVAGLEAPRCGEILADNAAITAPDPSRVVVFQDPTLYPWRTVSDNVALGLQAQGVLDHNGRLRVAQELERVGLAGFANAYPRQLSGGMASRAALARALVNRPRLLILDEPLGKLDSLTRIRMQGKLVSLWQERQYSALMVTHDVEEALLMADRVLVFSPRPARLLESIEVGIAHPRRRDDPRMITLRRAILELLGAA
ncbi:ABC transporter ATP-binding protein [Halotalea alkalilenta]|uniref:ABC transporter n=1 Tax=Halotalea alkalilenta TaxID=376489 RepID=A0A172YG64_9GAMM|nr:ABC transporter ATP-binding protein [Halotalea alkalilenta]ANF58096.1 ABC transporter [Halotalea alkalilenta]